MARLTYEVEGPGTSMTMAEVPVAGPLAQLLSRGSQASSTLTLGMIDKAAADLGIDLDNLNDLSWLRNPNAAVREIQDMMRKAWQEKP